MTEARQPLRAALVMNGGVSLAVWMGGVTHELGRLRTGSGDPSPAWKALREKAKRRDVDIDFVAGTSAGGLNGTLLATSIAVGTPLRPLLGLWLEKGRFSEDGLLDLRDDEKGRSALTGSGFQKDVVDELARLVTQDVEHRRPADVTLLVTATALAGATRTVTDLAGRPMIAPDHRRVYRFRRRSGRWTADEAGRLEPAEDLDEFSQYTADLSTAARASAGFPFAFRPVEETQSLRERDRQPHDTDRRAWLIDGGVLDNAPFGPLLDELRDTPLAVPAERWLVYVVPSVDVVSPGDDIGGGALPPAWTTVLGRLVGLFREADLRADVDELKPLLETGPDLQTRAEDLLFDCTRGANATARRKELQAASKALFNAYRRTRAQTNHNETPQERAAAREQALSEAERVLDAGPWWIPRTAAAGDDHVAWAWGISTAQRLTLWLSRDVRSGTGAGTLDAEEAAGILAETEHGLVALRDWMERTAVEAGAGADDVVTALSARSKVQLELGAPGRIKEVLDPAVQAWAGLRGLSMDEAYDLLLDVEVVLKASTWAGGEDPPPAFRFLKISPEQHFDWLPDDIVAGESGGDWAQRKLYGTAFGHFGAFGRDDWKRSDWLWGRLDAAAALAGALLGHLPEKERSSFVEGLVSEILAEETPPGGSAPTRDGLAAHVRRMTTVKGKDLLRELRSEPDGRRALSRALDNVSAMLRRALSPAPESGRGPKALIVRALTASARGTVRIVFRVGKTVNVVWPRRGRRPAPTG
jgi:predicted acylesterase/phospholipase RssA